jgi:hypothetical protein
MQYFGQSKLLGCRSLRLLVYTLYQQEEEKRRDMLEKFQSNILQ